MSEPRRYRVRHSTTYSYSDKVTSSYGRAFLTPRNGAGQRLLDHDIHIDPVPSDRSVGADVYGNISSYFHVTDEHRTLEITGESTVEVDPPPAHPAEIAWEKARPTAVTGPLAVEFTLDLRPPEITDEVTAYAAESLTPGRPLFDAVAELTSRINADFAYRSGSTTVSTRVADVFAARAGVCQDFARIGAACLRSHGLAARYVSGYLATDPPPGKERMVGADATHAWAAVWMPDDGWIGFDPTNDQFADERYVTVAWGRDYADVPPLRGIIYTDAEDSSISVSVDVAPLEASFDA
ncbi:transglutaminase family protein [Nocardia cyriacigeorgica]|uniref:Transglutaminase family protein n=1 Tax=Nocardia cyriacigeorgica TaxID=135487 RepID=A0ABX0CSH2_9NOCA|nr:transglutaminase family protein [Nocardia cyriacigeorgica]NEW59434.1 transglutaminase family protein [Nocardia cyriacigeorgica]